MLHLVTSQSNGVIEQLNRRIQGGARAHLRSAGLPYCFWPYAAAHWCALCNFTDRPDGRSSPYFLRYGIHFSGLIIPLGCLVYYYPAQTKYVHVNKAEPRLSVGIFLGYDLDYGAVWNGLYVVADLDDFAGQSLDANEPHTSFQKIAMPHYTKVIRIENDEVRFPLFERYQAANETILGRDQFYGHSMPAADQFMPIRGR